LFELAASQGDVTAQFNLGNMYYHGEGADQNYERAKEYYEPVAMQGDADAQCTLGIMYLNGQGVDQNYERAAEYFEAAAKQGMADAQFHLGALYANGQRVEQSNEIARAWWMKSAAQGDEDAIKGLQIMDKMEGRTTPSFTPPKRCCTCDTPESPTHKLNDCPCFGAQYCNAKCQTSNWKSHKKEHRRLCKELKLKNTEGEMKDEVVEEEGETKEIATEAADLPQQEEEDMCPVCIEALQKDTNKFVRYTCCGKGIHKWCDEGINASSLSREQKNSCPLCRAEHPGSNEEAIKQVLPWVGKGKPWAQCLLGNMYYAGEGVDQSYQRAKELYEFAASQGYGGAQYELGVMNEQGIGVDQSYERAKEYYEAAARQGHTRAQTNLGVLYYNGQGVEQSNETARKLWMKSAEQGHDGAIKNLQTLDKEEGRTTPSFVPKPIECASCYRPHDPSEHKLNACNGCHRVYYCGKECQVKHWKKKLNGHKERCRNKSN